MVFNLILSGLIVIQVAVIFGLFHYGNMKLKPAKPYRSLSDIEHQFLIDAFVQLKNHLKEKRFHTIWNWLFRVIWIPIWLLTALVCWVLVILAIIYIKYWAEYDNELGGIIETFEPSMELPMSLSLLGTVLAGATVGVCLASALTIVMCMFSPKYPQYRLLTHMDRTSASPEDILMHRVNRLEKDIRNKFVDVNAQFDGAKYLRKMYLKIGVNWFLAAIMFLPITLFGICAYAHTQTFFYDDEITYRLQIFGNREIITYDELDSVQKTCRVNPDSELQIYVNPIKNGKRIAIIDVDRRNLKRVKMIIKRLRQLDVSVIKSPQDAIEGKEKYGFPVDCLKRLRNEFDPEEVRDLKYILDIPLLDRD